tara:strand:- start:301 stop:669 length:369 start_codon:yes stop_codon:yes gene_type:complete
MAVTQSRDNRTIIAGADLSTSQFIFVKLNAAAAAVAVGDGEAAFGLLEVGAATGKACTVTKTGKVMVECGGAVTVGLDVAADANGKAIDAVATDVILGTAYETGVTGQIIAIELSDAGNIKA